MRIVICDDNPEDAKMLEGILRRTDPAEHWSVSSFTDSKELLDRLREKDVYDVALLDIDMPGINGIELGKAVKQLLPEVLVIFATAHPQYMLDAFDLEAFHYLLKPFDEDKVLSVLRRAQEKYAAANRYHCIKIKTQSIRIRLSELYFVEHCRKHVIYHTEKKDYEVTETLASAYEALKGFGFYQIHQGYLVNMEKIDRFEGYSVLLTDGRSVPVSVRKKAEVIAAYTGYIGRRANG